MFRDGQKLVCVDARGGHLVKGREYTCTGTDNDADRRAAARWLGGHLARRREVRSKAG